MEGAFLKNVRTVNIFGCPLGNNSSLSADPFTLEASLDCLTWKKNSKKSLNSHLSICTILI